MNSIERGQHNSIYPHKSPPLKRKEGEAGKSAGFTCVKPSLLLSDDIATYLSLTSVGSIRTRRGRPEAQAQKPQHTRVVVNTSRRSHCASRVPF